MDFSEGNLGRDFRSGLFASWGDSFARLLWETSLLRLSRSDRLERLPFPSAEAGKLLSRPSFGDLGLVTGICMSQNDSPMENKLKNT